MEKCDILFAVEEIMEKNKISVVKVLIKDHHDKVDDLVSSPLVRAFNKIGAGNINSFCDEKGIYLYCCLENDELYEIFTQRKLEMDGIDYEVVPSEELIEKVKSLNENEIGTIHSLIRKFVFGENVEVDSVELSTMEERAMDRAMLFKEYNENLSLINPYEKDHENDYNKSLVERFKIEKEIKDKLNRSRKN